MYLPDGLCEATCVADEGLALQDLGDCEVLDRLSVGCSQSVVGIESTIGASFMQAGHPAAQLPGSSPCQLHATKIHAHERTQSPPPTKHKTPTPTRKHTQLYNACRILPHSNAAFSNAVAALGEGAPAPTAAAPAPAPMPDVTIALAKEMEMEADVMDAMDNDVMAADASGAAALATSALAGALALLALAMA